MKDMLETRCDMKVSVMELVRKFGAPKEEESLIEGANQYENRVIQAILNGCNTKIEIAEYLGIPTHTTVLYGLDRIETALREDPQLQNVVDDITQNLRLN